MKTNNQHYIYYNKNKNMFDVSIRLQGEKIFIGSYKTIEDAILERDKYLQVIKENDIPKNVTRKRDLLSLILSFKEEEK
jgi:hypothetical protein